MINNYYKHFKGNIYKVIAIAKHSETLEDMVVYESVKTKEIWVRPLTMWDDEVEKDGITYKRFTKIKTE